MKINKLISTVIIFIITLVFLFLFVIPKYQKSNDLQNTLVKKQAEYNGESTYYAKISEVISNIEARKDILEKMDSALPANFSLAPLVYFFQKKAGESGLMVKSILFSQSYMPPTSKKIRNVMFTINVSGNYQGLKNFLSFLDTSARLFEVTSIHFIVPTDLGNVKNLQPVYNFQLEVQTNSY